MDIFEFVDYRVFLRKKIESLPKKGRGELSRLSQFTQVHPSLFSQILAGDKNLTLEQAQLVSEYLGLGKLELDYFLNCVLLQRAGSVKMKSYFREKLEILKKDSLSLKNTITQDYQLTDLEKSIFYSHWIYAGIWLFCSIDEGKSVAEIFAHFDFSKTKIIQVLDFLQRTKLIVQLDEKYKMGPQSIHLEKGSPYLYQHLSNWRLKAIERSPLIKEDELMYSAPISISATDFAKLRKKMSALIKELTEQTVASKAERLACFNIDFIWLE